MSSLRCQGNSHVKNIDHNKFSSSYSTASCGIFFSDILVHADMVNTQTFPLKKSSPATLRCYLKLNVGEDFTDSSFYHIFESKTYVSFFYEI